MASWNLHSSGRIQRLDRRCEFGSMDQLRSERIRPSRRGRRMLLSGCFGGHWHRCYHRVARIAVRLGRGAARSRAAFSSRAEGDMKTTPIHEAGLVARPIPGAPGYMAVMDGRLLSLPRVVVQRSGRRHPVKGGVMKQHDTGVAVIARCPPLQSMNVGGLLLRTFIGLPGRGEEYCHNDGDYRHNTIWNVRWASHSENERDKAKHGTSGRGAGTLHPEARAAPTRDIVECCGSGSCVKVRRPPFPVRRGPAAARRRT